MDKETSKGIEDYEDDKIEKKNKKNKVNSNISLLNSAKTDFIEENLDNDKNYFETQDKYFNTVVIEDFLEYLNNNSKYSELSLESIDYSSSHKEKISVQLKNEVIRLSVSNDKNSNTLLKLLEKNNEISKLDLIKLKEEIKNSKSLYVLEMLKSDLKRTRFLNSLNLTSVKEKDNWEKLKWIDFKKIQKEYEKWKFSLWIYQIIEKFRKNPNNLKSKEVIQLLTIFSDDEKKILLDFYNGTFSLNDLIKYRILDKKDAILYLKKSYEEIYPDLKKSEIYKILNSNDLEFTNIYISTQELKDKDLSKILKDKKILNNFFEVLEDSKTLEYDYVKKDFYNNLDLDSSWNIHNNFINFLKSRANNSENNFSSDFIKSLKKLEEWCYFEFTKDWETFYSRIDKIDLWQIKETKHITLQNLSDPSDSWKVRKHTSVLGETMSYENLYYYLRNSSNDDSVWFKILSKNDFLWKKIKETEEEDNILTEQWLKEKLIAEWLLTWNLINEELINLSLLDEKIKWKWIFRTFNIQWNKIILENGETWTLSQFFNLLKNEKKRFKFEKKIKNFDSFLDKLWLDDKEYSIKNNSLYYNPKGALKEKKVNFFIYWKWDEAAIQIHKITDTDIEYTIWEVKEKGTWKKDNELKEIKKKEFKAKDKFYKSWFDNFLKDRVFSDWEDSETVEPYTEWIEIKQEEDKWKKLEMKWSFFGSYMSWMSLIEIISSWKMIIDWLENHFKLWAQLKSAKLAEKMNWFLPDEIRIKMKAEQEAISKKEREEKVSNVLKELNSKEIKWGIWAYKYIEDTILHNPNVDMSIVFEAMKFMLEKKWALNVDWFLKNRWKFIWYQKLWWRVWDELYEKVKKERERSAPIKNWKPDPSFFNEEDLIQAKLKEMTGKGNIFSRADKDFAAARSTWHERRHKKGKEEASDLFTFQNRFSYFMGHLKKWEDDRAIWAFEAVMWKNKWNPRLMNKGPFIMAMWGFAKDYDDVNIKRLVTMAWSSPYTSLYFAADRDAMKVYQNAIKKLFIDNWQDEKARKLDSIINWDRTKVASKLETFWNDNSSIIWNFLNFSDWNIMLKKDTDKDPDRIYSKFYWTVKDVFTDPEFVFTEWDQLKTGMYEAHSGAAYVWFELGENTNIKSDQWWGYWDVNSKKIVHLYYNELNSIKNKTFSKNENENLEMKKKLFKWIYKEFEPTIKKALWRAVKDWEDNRNDDTLFISDLRDNNLIINAWTDKNENYDVFLEKAFKYFIEWSSSEKNSEKEKSPIEEQREKIKEYVNKYSSPDYEPESVYDDWKKWEWPLYQAMKERKEYDKRKKEEEEKEYA